MHLSPVRAQITNIWMTKRNTFVYFSSFTFGTVSLLHKVTVASFFFPASRAMNSFTHVSSSVKTRIGAKDFILLSSVYFSMQGILTPLTNQQLLLWQTSACFQHCLVWKSKLEVHSLELWGTTKASGNSVNYLVNILLRKDAINKYEITAIKDPICLREEYVICGSICF